VLDVLLLRPDLAPDVPEARPLAPLVLPLEFPLGAEEVRVAMLPRYRITETNPLISGLGPTMLP
jgi:hypothetical protein